ncbi:hypothetical protein ACJRO7_001646 [Eucalyptus globulus]|uniref:Uncharacterized protein n=1 Tax=Eucalyptus globulus TaxID=34317 RepID=A0ABD3LXB8_EUCGL
MSNRFRLCPLLLLLLLCLLFLIAPRMTQAAGRSLSVSSSSSSLSKEQPFEPSMNTAGVVAAPVDEGQAGDFATAEKRRVPTGSNPLHNKRLL